MTVRFRDHQNDESRASDETSNLPEDLASGAGMFPPAVLERHHSRVLQPSEAIVDQGAGALRSTVYRQDMLFVADTTVQDIAAHQSVEAGIALDTALKEAGLQVEAAERGPSSSGSADSLRPIRLCRCGDAPPGQVDAWKAAQAVRAACPTETVGNRPAAPTGLEHLLVGSAFVGVGGLTHGQPGSHDGTPVPGDGPGSYATPGRGGRVPVDLHLAAPPRTPRHELPRRRRITIAVLDTGLHQTPHSWLDVAERENHDDEFVVIDTPFQQAIADYWGPELRAVPQIDAMAGPWETDYVADPLLGEVATHFGHGTFITGVIRQAAPEAQVRSIRVMHNDGVAYESTVLAALQLLANEAESALRSGETLPVDIISLSLGYFDESPESAVAAPMAAVLDRLAQAGVIVVTAAGNFATTRRFYPAAFSDELRSDTGASLFSVAALNPNGSVALFSNDGPWVNCWATGAAVVSCFPSVASGSANPGTTAPDRTGMSRQTLDPDDFASGFAVWSGTSFAAPLVAAKLATGLAFGSDSPTVRARLHDPADNLARAIAAVGAINGGNK